jgi:hypothetical protein
MIGQSDLYIHGPQTQRDALLQCFPGIDIEVDEDVEDMVPWPFE